jgi:hypothetical protein
MKTGLPLSPATVPPSNVEVGTVSLKTLFTLPFGSVESGFSGLRNCASKNGALKYPMLLPDPKAPNSIVATRRLLSPGLQQSDPMPKPP